VRIATEGQFFEMNEMTGGYFEAILPWARPGLLYKFRLDDDESLYPDPESRYQPEGPHGPSQVIDPNSFRWSDRDWSGVDPEGQILYEMHLGTFTPEGTFRAAQDQLENLASMGITLLEIMPIAEFSGRWGWGYDNVDLFAPSHLYGAPDDAKRFVDEAHRLGLGVILDVVYNHFGPDGNYVKSFADEYFTDKYDNDWGEAINFSSEPVRDFYIRNAVYWIEEFHFDGLRLDATQDIHDESPEHILAAISKRIRGAAGKRKVYIVAENEPQQSWITNGPGHGGYGIDALWNDDFHHSAMVAMTGRKESYYTDYRGAAQEFVSAAKYGYLYQGQRYEWQNKRRGSPAFDLKPWNFVAYLQNHDQIANSARGDRVNVLTNPALYRAMSALLMLGPATPMLFQGQEFGATTPFLYFCDHESELCDAVNIGRRNFLAQFRSLAQPQMQEQLIDPSDPRAFERSKLDFSEREKNQQLFDLYGDLIRLRREDPVLHRPQPDSMWGGSSEANSIDQADEGVGRGTGGPPHKTALHWAHGLDGAVLSSAAFVLRYFSRVDGDRLLLFNLGPDLHLAPAPEPLLAPPKDNRWSVLWSSEHPRYGGSGTFPPDSDENWRIAAYSAVVLIPAETSGERA
jgi:maltooligosyltrehalose trehalohydrolase